MLNEFFAESEPVLQELVNNHGRRFFTGEAKHLRVQIGMHTGIG